MLTLYFVFSQVYELLWINLSWLFNSSILYYFIPKLLTLNTNHHYKRVLGWDIPAVWWYTKLFIFARMLDVYSTRFNTIYSIWTPQYLYKAVTQPSTKLDNLLYYIQSLVCRWFSVVFNRLWSVFIPPLV